MALFSKSLSAFPIGVQLLILLLIAFGIGTLVTGMVAALGLVALGTGNEVSEEGIAALMGNNAGMLRLVQAGSILGFFILPALFFNFHYNIERDLLQPQRKLNAKMVLLSVLLLLVSQPLLYALVNLNEAILFPESFKIWAVAKEDEAKVLLDKILSDTSVSGLLLNLGMIAVLPAIGEELLFRGVIQQLFFKWFTNKHVAVWLGAALFSALHFQFMGFLPRMVLGALLGYTFYVSKNIVAAMVLHAANNALALSLDWSWRKGYLNVSEDALKTLPVAYSVVSLLLTIVVGTLFIQYANTKNKLG